MGICTGEVLAARGRMRAEWAEPTGVPPAAEGGRRGAASQQTPPRLMELALPWGAVGAYELSLRAERAVPAGFSAEELTRLITAVESC